MKPVLLILSVTLATCAVAQPSGSPSAQMTVIRAGTLIDGKSDKPRHDQVIVIQGNLIASVADAATAKIPPGAALIDLSKETVLPGLIDSHTHIFLQGEDPAQGGYDANILNAPLALRAARATVAARRRWSKASPHCATWRPRAPATATWASSKPSKADTFPGPGCWL